MIKLLCRVLCRNPYRATGAKANSPIGATGDDVDPFALLLGNQLRPLPGDAHDLAVLATGHQALAVCRDVGRQQAVMGFYDGFPSSGKTHRAINQREGGLIIDEPCQFDMFVEIVRRDCRHLGGNTGVESALNLFAIEIAADEDQSGLTLFVGMPWALMITFHDHMHPLHHEAIIVAGKGDDALQA